MFGVLFDKSLLSGLEPGKWEAFEFILQLRQNKNACSPGLNLLSLQMNQSNIDNIPCEPLKSAACRDLNQTPKLLQIHVEMYSFGQFDNLAQAFHKQLVSL